MHQNAWETKSLSFQSLISLGRDQLSGLMLRALRNGLVWTEFAKAMKKADRVSDVEILLNIDGSR